MPRGMMEILCTGSTSGSAMALIAWPSSWVATVSRSSLLRMRLRFSRPATMRSIAASKSSRVMLSALRRVASRAASLARLARSAPVKPGVSAAIASALTPGAMPTLARWMRSTSTRPFLSGRSTSTWRSNRPARSSAGSSTSGRLVEPMMTRPVLGSKPSISESSWFSVCSFSSWPPMPGPLRAPPSASISSMKMMAGAFSRACLNMSRTRAAPTPTIISTNSEPEMEKNGTPVSPATARASSVLPVPGGPTSSTPFGTCAPSRP